MPAWASTVLVVAGCTVLAWAGLEKIRDRKPLAATLAALGLPPRGAVLVPLLELATVLAVVVGVPSYVDFVLFAALGTAFAVAGVRGLAGGRTISCACFGASERRLGWFQIVTLPAWWVVGFAATRVPASTLRERLAVLACGMLVLAAARAVPALRRGIEARADRRAMAGAR